MLRLTPAWVVILGLFSVILTVQSNANPIFEQEFTGKGQEPALKLIEETVTRAMLNESKSGVTRITIEVSEEEYQKVKNSTFTDKNMAPAQHVEIPVEQLQHRHRKLLSINDTTTSEDEGCNDASMTPELSDWVSTVAIWSWESVEMVVLINAAVQARGRSQLRQPY